MATISKTQSGKWKAQVGKIGFPAGSNTFKAKQDAKVWSRSVESEQDRGVFVNRSEADRITVGELIDRYIQEVTPQKRSAKNDKQRILFLKKSFGHFIRLKSMARSILCYRFFRPLFLRKPSYPKPSQAAGSFQNRPVFITS
jgi:hypothetical protein